MPRGHDWHGYVKQSQKWLKMAVLLAIKLDKYEPGHWQRLMKMTPDEAKQELIEEMEAPEL